MKKKVIFLALIFLFIGGLTIFAGIDSISHAKSDTTAVKSIQVVGDVTDSVTNLLLDGLMKVLNMIHSGLFFLLIISASLFNESVEAINVSPFLNWAKKIPRGARTFLIGVLYLVIGMWAYRVKDRVVVLHGLVTILAAMCVMSTILNKVTRKFSEKIGLKF